MVDITLVFGTRPEAIKMAPIIHSLRSSTDIKYKIVLTGQHKEMAVGILDWFNITPDINLDVMEKNQTLSSLTSKAINLLDEYFKKFPTKIVIVQGDTTSALVAALVGFYHKFKIAHVEAGLRTGNNLSPWPEEVNRKLICQIANYHFAPTKSNKTFLLNENIKPEQIIETGNTVIDALKFSINKVKQLNIHPSILEEFYSGQFIDKKIVLITGHRRENFGEGFRNVCRAIKFLSEKYKEAHFVYPVHLNPNVRKTVFDLLGGIPNIHLIDPLQYPEFISLMERSFIILTDSGGVQEEAPSLNKPVLVFRENTERPEAVEAGLVKVVGLETENIVNAFTNLYENPTEFKLMSNGVNPYGDGYASERIVSFLKTKL